MGGVRLFSSSAQCLVTRPITRPNRLLNAEKVQLDDGAEFFINPPPSSSEAYPDASSVASGLLDPSAAAVDTQNAPSLHARKHTLNYNLSEAEIEEIKQLRRTGHSANALARQFNCSKGLIAVVAPASKENRLEHTRSQEEQRQNWGFNKQLSRQQRQKRKEYW